MNTNIRLVILDRDGVININSANYIKIPAEWHPIKGSLEAIAQLKAAGFLVAIATNQSGIGKNYYTLADLEKIHTKMLTRLASLNTRIDALEFCPHAPEKNCACRKPQPGMLITIGKKLQVPPHASVYIGDSLKDLQAASNYGCHSYLVKTGHGLRTLKQMQEQRWEVPVFANLQAAARHLIQ